MTPSEKKQIDTPEHTIRNNFLIWASYDWSNLGREWIPSSEWKQSFAKNVLLKYLPKNGTVLEIGPGAGEWTMELIPHCNRLILVDLVPRCIEICKERFQNFDHIEYHTNDGKTLNFVKNESLDFVFSMDVFVQLSKEVISTYLNEIAKKLKPGGFGLIHHAKKGRTKVGWRSDITDATIQGLCDENGLEIIQQLSSWENGKYQIWPKDNFDSVTILKKINF